MVFQTLMAKSILSQKFAMAICSRRANIVVLGLAFVLKLGGCGHTTQVKQEARASAPATPGAACGDISGTFQAKGESLSGQPPCGMYGRECRLEEYLVLKVPVEFFIKVPVAEATHADIWQTGDSLMHVRVWKNDELMREQAINFGKGVWECGAGVIVFRDSRYVPGMPGGIESVIRKFYKGGDGALIVQFRVDLNVIHFVPFHTDQSGAVRFEPRGLRPP